MCHLLLSVVICFFGFLLHQERIISFTCSRCWAETTNSTVFSTTPWLRAFAVQGSGGGGAPYGGFTGRLLPKAVFFVLFLFFAIPAGERIDLFLSYEKKDQFLFLVFEKGTVASRISILKVMV